MQVKLDPQPRYLETAMLMSDRRVVVISSRLSPEVADIFIYAGDSKLLYTHHLTTEVFYQGCGSIDNREIFYLLPSLNQWGVLDVITFEERRGEFAFVCPRFFRSRVVFFPASESICIWEIGDFNEKGGRLTFMKYPKK